MQPGQGAFHNPAPPAQAGAVPGPAAGDDRGDAPLAQQPAVAVVVVAAVGVDLAGAPSRPSAPATDRWNRLQERQQLGDVVAVAAGQDHGQGDAGGVGDHMVLAAQPAPADRAGTGEVPPLRARRCEESTTVCARSNRPAERSSASRVSCSRCHTPAWCHSFIRRQQVAPETPNAVVGRSFQRMPCGPRTRCPPARPDCRPDGGQGTGSGVPVSGSTIPAASTADSQNLLAHSRQSRRAAKASHTHRVRSF